MVKIDENLEFIDSFCFSNLDNSRRQDDELPFSHNKQADDMRDSLDYTFATGLSLSLLFFLSMIFIRMKNFLRFSTFLAFYRNCLLELNTHRSDVDYALNNIYREHYEDIDLTEFLRAICQHFNRDAEK